MQFEQQGRIFLANGQRSWMMHHSQVPTLFMIDGKLRIYFTTRHIPEGDDKVVSNTGFIDVDPLDPHRIIGISEQPILPLGGPGTFDEFGIMPGSVIKIGQRHYFYYTGWTRGYTVPHNTCIGLAISEDGGNTFSKIGQGPVMATTYNEPYLVNGPYVIEHEGQYHMWYASATKWLFDNGKYESIYVIMHARSGDGINWVRDGKPCIPESFANEALNRPSVVKIGDLFHMWYSYRSGTDFRGAAHGYKMGHATSVDLQTWTRDDASSGLTLSAEGWDSEMQAYPDLIKIGDELHIFYNGNTFGKEGFGFAKIKIS